MKVFAIITIMFVGLNLFSNALPKDELLNELKAQQVSLDEKYNKLQSLKEQKEELLSLKNISDFNDDLLYQVSTKYPQTLSMKSAYDNIVDDIELKLNTLEKVIVPLDEKAYEQGKEIEEAKVFRVGAQKFFYTKNRAGLLDENSNIYAQEYSQMILDFVNNKGNELVFDRMPSANIKGKQSSIDSVLEDIKLGGLWIYPIIILGFLCVIVCVYKSINLLLIKNAPVADLKAIIALLNTAKTKEALELSSTATNPYKALIDSFINSNNQTKEAQEEISYECMLSQGQKTFSFLSVLSVSSAVAPLLGLLGTVTGIIRTFADLGLSNAKKSEFISEGISQALITTEYGLIVAIFAFIVHAILSRKAKAVMSNMEKISSMFLSR